MTPPAFPVGPFSDAQGDTRSHIETLADLPRALRAAIDGLSDAQLDTRYRNWSLRQIVHHIADSHANAYLRTMLALTEDRPTIKPYDETTWSALPHSRSAAVGPSLALIDGLHAKWSALLRSLPEEDMRRVFHHPESGRDVSLIEVAAQYAWHARHHTGQILWRRDAEGWATAGRLQ